MEQAVWKELAQRELARRSFAEYLSYVQGRMWKRTRMAEFLAGRVQTFLEAETGHALEEHGHRKRGHLIVRDRAVREAVNDEADLLVRQGETVALFFDQIYHSHGKNSFQVVLG